MSVRENTPTFKYVAVENLVITYNQKPYPIKNMYTNKKYIIWNIDRPNQLEDSNVRPEESLLEYLIVINDNGIPTILSHDNLTLSFDAATNGFSSNGDFDSIKDQVNENTKKYNLLIKDVDGITNVIGKTEELKDGSIIYNLNKIKADSESFGVQLEEVKTQVDDKFKDLKPTILNNLIDYSKSVSEYKLSLTSLKNDVEVTEEELSKINTNKTNMSNSLTALLTSLDSLKSILDSVNDETKSQLITDAKNQLTLLNNALINACDTALLDNKLSDYEKTTITQKAYELSQYIGVVQNTCNNITVGGSDGIIYKVQNEFLLYKDKTENNITELSRDGDLLNSKLSSYKQTMDEIDLSVKKVTSQYNEDKEMVKIKENIISLAIEENTLLGELSSIIKNAFEDDTISIEEKTNIQSKRDLIVVKKDLLLTEIDKVLAKLLESNDTTNHANLTNKKDGFSTSLVNMINKLNSIINKSNVTSNDTNTLVDLITTSKTKLTDLKNTCDEIISLGFGGAIYEQLSDFQIKSDGIISTVKEITQDAKGNIKSSVIKYYASTSQTELVGGKWEDTIPLDANKFIWIKIVTTYGDGTIKEGTPTCISSKGLNGADGVDGKDGTSIIWQGTFSKHPSNPQNGWAYYNTSDKKSYVYQSGTWYQMTVDGQDGLDGNDGKDGLSIEHKGTMVNPPSNPKKNWTYKDSDNGVVYIYTGTAWEVMTYDGSDGVDGTNGTDGLSVFVTYHDSPTQPYAPTGNGTTGGWHTNCTSSSVWISQKVSSNANTGTWGTPIKIKGQDGTTYYTWIMYADDQYGNGISNDPTGKEYIGFAYNKTTPTESTNKYEYTWSLIKGTDGVPGRPGQDGITYYTWIKYSDYSNGNPCYDTPNSNTKYIGIATNKTTSYESSDYTQYKWSLFKGADGVPGQDGVSVEEVVIEYAKNQYTTTAPTTGWSTSMPSYQKGYYLWYRTRIKYSNSSYYVYSTPVCDQSWKASQEVYTQYEQLKDKFTWIVSSGTSQSNMVLSEKLYELTTQRAIISAKKIELNGSININGGTFKVDTSGNMTCNSGTFKGAIIGGTIDINNGIFKVASNGNTKIGGLCTHTNSDGTSRGIFEVTSEGTVYSRHKTNQNIYTMLTEGKITVKNNEGTLTFTNGQMKISDGSTATYYGDGYIGHNNSIMVETPRLNCTQIVTATKFTSGTNAILKSELNSSTNGSGGSIYLCCNGGDYNDTDSRVIRYFKNSDGNYVFRPNSKQGVMYLGTATYPFGNVISKKLTQTSDRTLKKNITYLSNSISTYNLNNDISIEDCYNFVSNDLPIATYNYIDDNDKKIGFIAQDLLYNKDETDNKIGQLIVNPKGYTEENGKLTYDLGNYVSVLAGALQVAIRKIENLEGK